MGSAEQTDKGDCPAPVRKYGHINTSENSCIVVEINVIEKLIVSIVEINVIEKLVIV